MTSKEKFGKSKYIDKQLGISNQFIYSCQTRKTYQKQCCLFVKYCKENYGCKTLEDCRKYVNDYLLSRDHLSAYTLKLDASAIAKLYGCSIKDFIKTKPRKRSEIKRSRYHVKRDKHFSKVNNQKLISFGLSTGLRRSEMSSLRGNQLRIIDGKYYIYVKGKGGKERLAPIIRDVDFVVSEMKKSGSNKIFKNINSFADIHHLRAKYATKLYFMNKRDLSKLDKKDLYFCRKDKNGVILDKTAMRITSNALGHNRLSIIASHYIRGK